ncbi:hypothetical protein AMTR_s00008p00138040 [Amborella trichopoda]|uniref:Bifunctional inhibitor/plant lipid transfer protein/seed storage helical domain-containing protein n=1 Tax=Amborella trichopoda TaxID=13333 RepID=W1NIJ2_AMBTC|nr:hypothetical protein AMTR_s00008p00138040 [Amborella trichopoda]
MWLLYVQGEAAAPTKDCCRVLKQVVEKSEKCLCILIKYSTDPTTASRTTPRSLPSYPTLVAPPSINSTAQFKL